MRRTVRKTYMQVQILMSIRRWRQNTRPKIRSIFSLFLIHKVVRKMLTKYARFIRDQSRRASFAQNDITEWKLHFINFAFILQSRSVLSSSVLFQQVIGTRRVRLEAASRWHLVTIDPLDPSTHMFGSERALFIVWTRRNGVRSWQSMQVARGRIFAQQITPRKIDEIEAIRSARLNQDQYFPRRQPQFVEIRVQLFYAAANLTQRKRRNNQWLLFCVLHIQTVNICQLKTRLVLVQDFFAKLTHRRRRLNTINHFQCVTKHFHRCKRCTAWSLTKIDNAFRFEIWHPMLQLLQHTITHSQRQWQLIRDISQYFASIVLDARRVEQTLRKQLLFQLLGPSTRPIIRHQYLL
mmetsp:Transcript_6219/g.9857  ORF Transcript_6219/g.9857 Transcript_6219/m.9857 type:complete len:351 (+) Transcript_6219:633-1685(+)